MSLPTTERIDLGDGDWAELTLRPSHAAVNTIYKAYTRSIADQEQYLDLEVVAIAALLSAWSVRGPDGQTLPTTPEGVAAAPFDLLEPIFDRAMELFGRTQKDPKGSTAKLP